ncbi:MAG: adenosylcobinamide-GDP ribazoletransferase [Ruminococcus sp.]|nr:adenosylcobinamide-GDP ribazoletransferase [Ruminococcus sp.]
MIKSLFSAFLMYSRIPMPRVEWKEENRRYALGFFPLVGAVIGWLFTGWRQLCQTLGLWSMLFAAVSVLIPLAVTGGIHMDGFMDVTDARNSFGDREKKLEIMSDPHVGSFAVIWGCVYLIVQAGLFSQAYNMRTCSMVSAVFVLSRSLSAFGAICFKSAKSQGSLQSFKKPAHKGITLAMTGAAFLFSAGMMVRADFTVGAACVVTAAAVLVFCRRWAYKELGGFTGDVCGWFLQLCEIFAIAVIVIGERIATVVR